MRSVGGMVKSLKIILCKDTKPNRFIRDTNHWHEIEFYSNGLVIYYSFKFGLTAMTLLWNELKSEGSLKGNKALNQITFFGIN